MPAGRAVPTGPGAVPGAAVKRPAKPNFAVVFGAITKIDASDPAKSKLEVKSDADGTTHALDIMPWTNVSKVTDLSELKVGDTVRVMSRKVEGKDVAVAVVFGKIKNLPRPKPSTATTPPAQAPGKK